MLNLIAFQHHWKIWPSLPGSCDTCPSAHGCSQSNILAPPDESPSRSQDDIGHYTPNEEASKDEYNARNKDFRLWKQKQKTKNWESSHLDFYGFCDILGNPRYLDKDNRQREWMTPGEPTEEFYRKSVSWLILEFRAHLQARSFQFWGLRPASMPMILWGKDNLINLFLLVGGPVIPRIVWRAWKTFLLTRSSQHSLKVKDVS